MRGRMRILLSVILAGAAVSGYGAEAEPRHLLADGFILGKVEGRLASRDSNEGSVQGWSGWFFEFASDVSDGGGSVKAGEKLELLPSATLEQMVADAAGRGGAGYQLRGRVTRYKGKNFIFPRRFAPLNPAGRQETRQHQGGPNDSGTEQESSADTAANEANDVVTIPAEVMEKLQGARSIGRTAAYDRSAVGLGRRGDYLIADRTGAFENLGEQSTGAGHKAKFVVDGLGRNLAEIRFKLLPCEALERAERAQSGRLEQLRFKIAAIATRYEGKGYLLLEKADRAYGYGNFPE